MSRRPQRHATARQRRIQNVMRRFEQGKLRSFSGDIVRNRRQALAIALEESGVQRSRRTRRK